MRVLVTGAAGYVGQHLCLALMGADLPVRGLSRSPCPPGLASAEVEWVQGDVTNPETVRWAVAGCSRVVHLACLALGASARSPEHAVRVNTEGTVVVLEATRRAEPEQVVFTSSGQVYGGQAALPNRETDPPRPDSPYAASKLCAETWCELYARAHGLPVHVLRLFNVYGPAADGSLRTTVETLFLQQIAQGHRLQMREHAQSGRDFVHVDDVVRAIRLALNHPNHSGVTNVGSGVLTTLVDLAHAAAHALGRAVEPERVPTEALPVRFQADTSRAQALLGFTAQVTLEAGLQALARTL